MRDWRARRPARDVTIVADDDAVIRRLLRVILEETGYRVQLAALDGAVERGHRT